MAEKERDEEEFQDFIFVAAYPIGERIGKEKGRMWFVKWEGIEGGAVYVDDRVEGYDAWVVDLDREMLFPVGGKEITPWIYIHVKGGIYRSRDWGKSWDLFTEGIKKGEWRKIIFGHHPPDLKERDMSVFSYERGGLDWDEVLGGLEEIDEGFVVWFATDKGMQLASGVVEGGELLDIVGKFDWLALLWKLIEASCRKIVSIAP